MDFIRIPATVLKQKDKELYLFKMSSALLREITFVTPRSAENPDELQRVYSESRAKEIGAWIKEENSLLPNAIVVDFKDDVLVQRVVDSMMKDLPPIGALDLKIPLLKSSKSRRRNR